MTPMQIAIAMAAPFVLGMMIALAIDWHDERRRNVHREQDVRDVLRRNKIHNWRVGRW